MNIFKTINMAVLGFALGALSVYLLYPSLKPAFGVQQTELKKPLYWVAPMDENYRRDQPGKSPMGMDLVPVYHSEKGEKNAPGTVLIKPAVINNLGLRLGKVDKQDLSRQVKTVGFIGFNEQTVSHFHSRVEGWIEELSVTAVGDPVKKGQKLYELYSPELVNAQEEYLVATNGHGSRLVKAAERKLKALGVDQSQILSLKKAKKVSQRMPFYAQQNGYVAVLNVREGSFIKPATNVLSVGALDSVWVIAEIFERQAAWVTAGQSVVMTTESYPELHWQGTVDYVYPVLDNQTRTLRARVVFNNQDQRLKPNMFAQLSIEGNARKDVLVIPKEAVIRSRGVERVVKSLGEGNFRSVRIQTGIESHELIEVLAGLQAGDEVVISAQFLIDSESSISAELSRIEDPHVEKMTAVTMDRAADNASPEGIKKSNDPVVVSGEITEVMIDMGMLNVRHGPVKAWSWPAMTMMFQVSESVNLRNLNVGQKIEFELIETAEGDYKIIKIYE